MTEIDKLALDVHRLITFVIGSICFLIALWVIYRARHEDEPHPDARRVGLYQPRHDTRIAARRRVIFGTFIAAGLSWPTSLWASPVGGSICQWLPFLIECWLS